MKIFNPKDLKEIQKEKKAKQIEKKEKKYKKQIQDLKKENTSLREELELTQKAINEILFNTLGGE